MTKWKRRTAFILSMIMLFSLLPVPVFATEEQVPVEMVLEAPEDDASEAPNADSGVSDDAPDVSGESPPAAVDVPSEAVSPPPAESVRTLSTETGPGGQNPNPGGTSNVDFTPDGKKPEEPPAYEISYNLSGSGGQWIVVGGDESRLGEQSYVLFNQDKEKSYAVQLREEDCFPFFLEIRYRMEADGAWSVLETYRFDAPNEAPFNADGNPVNAIKGHKITAQSKWLTEIRYRMPGGGWTGLSENHYDKADGSYLLEFPDTGEFPLSVEFEYRTRANADASYGDAIPYKVSMPEENAEKNPEFADMNSTVNVLGQTFRLNPAKLGKAEYAITASPEKLPATGDWVTVGPGEEREFDHQENYTINLNNEAGVKDTTAFPFTIYLRALETDGWKYLDGKSELAASYKQYANVLDTANINGHVFALHADWMNDVRYAFVEDSAFTSEAKEDYTLPGEESFFTVGKDVSRKEHEKYDCFDENGNYTIELDSSREYPFHIVFQSISPTGQWDSILNWGQAERMAHLKRFADVNATAEYDGHVFSLRSRLLGTIEYTMRNGAGGSRSRTLSPNGKWADKDNRCPIVLTDADVFPITVTFRFLTEKGWVRPDRALNKVV